MSKNFDFDLICIGLGPAGMAVSIMGSEMGLKVCGIEKNSIGGECMNVGCIPSKSLLRVAKLKYGLSKLKEMGLVDDDSVNIKSPFSKIDEYIRYIGDSKTLGMFEKVDLVLKEGSASFVNQNTVKVGDKTITAKKIFIATGTSPMIPPISGIKEVEVLTNDNIFDLKEIPKSMTIIGGGAIGCEMAQAFARLGTKCSIVQMDEFLVPVGDKEAGILIEEKFKKEGITVHNSQKIISINNVNGSVCLKTESGLEITSEKLLMAAGRKINLEPLKLENANIENDGRKIPVDNKQRTNIKNIYAVGDCTGGIMLSHAAMHQGMFAIMNAVSPFSMFKFTKYVIPWTVFTEPQISHVGMTDKQLDEKGVKYQTHTIKYEDYGAAIAENITDGFIKVYSSSLGKVYGASIVGEGSGEMINEWALIIQNKIRLHKVMFLAHSFPTMGFLSKRISEIWMMKKMKSKKVQTICKLFFRKF